MHEMRKLLIKLLTFVATTLNRLLVISSLVIAVLCCGAFMYGLLTLNYKLCIVSSAGAVAFVWVNKQT